jgi:hypothetical protein
MLLVAPFGQLSYLAALARWRAGALDADRRRSLCRDGRQAHRRLAHLETSRDVARGAGASSLRRLRQHWRGSAPQLRSSTIASPYLRAYDPLPLTFAVGD